MESMILGNGESSRQRRFNAVVLSQNYQGRDSSSAVRDFVEVLRSIPNIDVRVLVRNKGGSNDPHVFCFLDPVHHIADRMQLVTLRIFRRLISAWPRVHKWITPIAKTDRKYAMQTYDETHTPFSTDVILKKLSFQPSAIFVMMTHRTISYKNLYEINQRTGAPVFLIPWDMNPATGGCHYAWDCEGFKAKCGKCPALYSNVEHDQSHQNWLFKKQYVDKTDIRLMCGPGWTAERLSESSIFQGKSFISMELPVDENLFRPGDRLRARKRFNIEPERLVILFGAVSVENPRKGFGLLISALQKLNLLLEKESRFKERIHLLISGSIPKRFSLDCPFNFTSTGLLSSLDLVSAYQAADVYVSPTVQDAGPLMVSQALLSGVPVVAFRMGIASHVIKDGENGFVCEIGDVNAFALSIKSILEMKGSDWKNMSENARKLSLTLNSKTAVRIRLSEFIESNFPEAR